MRGLLARLASRRRERALRDMFAVVTAMRSGEQHFVYPLTQALGMGPGRVYPALAEFERRGWVRSGWQDQPDYPGRPRRRWYQLTPEGLRQARGHVIEERP